MKMITYIANDQTKYEFYPEKRAGETCCLSKVFLVEVFYQGKKIEIFVDKYYAQNIYAKDNRLDELPEELK